MDKRVIGTLLGIAGMLLWFMPWTEFSMQCSQLNATPLVNLRRPR